MLDIALSIHFLKLYSNQCINLSLFGKIYFILYKCMFLVNIVLGQKLNILIISNYDIMKDNKIIVGRGGNRRVKVNIEEDL